MLFRLLSIIIVILLLAACSKNQPVYQPTEKKDPFIIYEEGYDLFLTNDFFNASKKFAEAEMSFENMELAAKSSIMLCFSLYGINFYDESIENLNKFIKTYPADKNIIYAEYLKAIIYFEQIGDEKKDIKPLLDAKNQIDYFIKKYPKSDYTDDLKFKKDLIQDQLAAKELFVARYYITVQKWIPAINRLQIIVNEYDKTVYVEEALHRLVEIYYYLNLEKEAKKYASILGYNYNSSKWFEKSYKILNKDYIIENNNKDRNKKEKDNLINKIIKMIK